MGQYLTIYINEESVFDYDGTASLDSSRLEFLNKMDTDMNCGIKIQGESINEPDADQRAKFVVMNLIRALQQENDAIITASCTYLTHRIPELTEVHARNNEGPIKIEFIERET